MDSDLIWSDNPEEKYLKRMLQEKAMDDSLLGDSTVHDIMNGGKKRVPAKDVEDQISTTDSLGFARQEDPEMAMISKGVDVSTIEHPKIAIIGREEDLSTIDNDTINGSIRKSELGESVEYRETKTRNFEYATPKKQYKKSYSDDDTAPETPPKMVPTPPKILWTSSRSVEGWEDDEFQVSLLFSQRWKRFYECAALLALFLIIAVFGLGLVLVKLRSEETSDNNNFGGFNLPPPSFPAPAPAPQEMPVAMSPTVVAPTNAPVAPVALPPTTPPTIKPTIKITSPPVSTAVKEAIDDLSMLLVERSLETAEILQDPASPKYQSFEWITTDPNYFDYGPDRVVQRWVLGVFFFGLSEKPGFDPASDLQLWVTDANECSWYSTRPNSVCNKDGLYRSLDLRESNLYGPIPPELALLSNSLVEIMLPNNSLFGVIPTALGKLSLLERLRLSSNFLIGNIPTELGRLTKLEVLGMGRNMLSGSIPKELETLRELDTFGLEGNGLSGSIPSQLGSMENLRSLTLEDNYITGTLPWELGALEELESVKLGNNDITGEIPWEICQLRNESLQILSVDCGEVECSCCDGC